jgi:hypothetical protein
MTNPWGSTLTTLRKEKEQKFEVYLTKGVQVNPKAYCCDSNTINDAKPPVAILTVTPNPINEGENATLDLSSSYDPDGVGIADPAGYELWDGIGGNYPATKTQLVNYPNAGRYEAQGVVTDASGLKGEASTWVDVIGSANPVEPPGSDGKVVYVATHNGGIARCDDITASPRVWTAINNGLTGNALHVWRMRFDPSWQEGNKRAVIVTEAGVYTADDVDGTPTWECKLSLADMRTLVSDANAMFAGFCYSWNAPAAFSAPLVTSSIYEDDYIGIFVGYITPYVSFYCWYCHSHDWGDSWTAVNLATWFTLGQDTFHIFQGGGYSNHFNDRLTFLAMWTNSTKRVIRSTDGGHVFSELCTIAAISGTQRHRWGIPYKKLDGSVNVDEDEVWIANPLAAPGSSASVKFSSNGVCGTYSNKGPSAPNVMGMGQSVHNPQFRAACDWDTPTANVPHVWYTKDGGGTWALGWTGAANQLNSALSGFPYNGQLCYWGGSAPSNAVYLRATGDFFAHVLDITGDINTKLTNPVRPTAIIPDWTA